MKRVMMTAAVISMLAAAGSATAQTNPPKQKPARTYIDFNEVTIETDAVKPNGGMLIVLDGPKFRNLVERRADFARELHRSTDNL